MFRKRRLSSEVIPVRNLHWKSRLMPTLFCRAFLISRVKLDDIPAGALAAAFLPHTPTKSRPTEFPQWPSSGDDKSCDDHECRIDDCMTGRNEGSKCRCAMVVHLKEAQWQSLCVFVRKANRVDHRHTRKGALLSNSACGSCVLARSNELRDRNLQNITAGPPATSATTSSSGGVL